MGCGHSSGRSTSTFTFDSVRVVHVNGYVEDFMGPLTVGEVTGKPPRFVCLSPAQLLSFGARPLGLDEKLEPGCLYFLLPPSVLHSDSSPVDLAALATRLTALARRNGSKLSSSGRAELNSPAGCHAEDRSLWEPETVAGRCAHRMGNGMGGHVAPSRVRSWKPVLDTIEERSFRRPSMNGRSSSM